MTIVGFVFLLFAGIGLSHIIADSSIASSFKYKLLQLKLSDTFKNPLKVLIHMSNCHQCNGFWSGIFVYLLSMNYSTLLEAFTHSLLWGFIVSLLSPFWASLYVYVANLVSFDEELENEEN